MSQASASKRKKKQVESSLIRITKTLYDIDLFTPDPENARGHDERNIKAIEDSIRQFDQRIPILVDANLVIRKGNGTWLAMKRLGERKIWAIPLELEGAAATAFAIADNRSAELAHWEWQIVKDALLKLQDEGQDIEHLGFADFELEPLLSAVWKPPAVKSDEDAQEDDQDDNATERILLATGSEFRMIKRAIKMAQSQQMATDGQALSRICEEWMSNAKA